MMFQRYEVLMATPALSHWDVKVGGTSMEEMRVRSHALLEVRHRFLVGSGRPSARENVGLF